MHPREVVGREMKRQGGPEVVPLPAESVGQAGEPSHLHPDMQVCALDVGRANPLLSRGEPILSAPENTGALNPPFQRCRF